MAIIAPMVVGIRNCGGAWLVAATLLLTACGSIQWPPPDDPRLARLSDESFVNATAVKVGAGDTVYAIARRHQVSPRDIIQVNRLQPPYRLEVGQRLELPAGRIHTVVRGESLSIIGKHYDQSAYAIARINSIRKPYTIYPGQKLRIPRGAVTQVADSATMPKRTSQRPSQQPTLSAPSLAGSGWMWPANGKVVSTFGPKEKGLQNDGINIVGPAGSPIRAAENGVVAYAGNELRAFGNLLLVKHSGGWMTAYAHNDTLLVKRGDKVSRGQEIAKMGSSGNVTSPQLHFELRKGRQAVDPQKYLKDKRA